MDTIKIFHFYQLTGFHDVEMHYQEFKRHFIDNQYSEAIFDLRNIGFFVPEALLPLIMISKLWAVTKGHPVEWLLDDLDTLRYLERMNVFTLFPDYIITRSQPSNAWSRSANLNIMEIQLISDQIEQNSLDVPQILALVMDLMVGRVSPDRIGATSTLLSEVAQNVTHSRSNGYALMQVYKAATGHQIHIGVADLGIGIPRSLQIKYPDIGSPSDYLRKSLEAGVSSKSNADGLGLYQVQQLVRNNTGTLTIRSDTAMLQIYDGRIYQRDHLTPIPGTQVFITLWGRHDTGTWDYLLPTD